MRVHSGHPSEDQGDLNALGPQPVGDAAGDGVDVGAVQAVPVNDDPQLGRFGVEAQLGEGLGGDVAVHHAVLPGRGLTDVVDDAGDPNGAGLSVRRGDLDGSADLGLGDPHRGAFDHDLAERR